LQLPFGHDRASINALRLAAKGLARQHKIRTVSHHLRDGWGQSHAALSASDDHAQGLCGQLRIGGNKPQLMIVNAIG
jgi:hypothetical protein